ncbi:MAG: hypothetical protein JW778_04880 [Candidatus Altiarchaeota archaeon]|nr:hypothetical protein [Candidatus Altiarchaeota archaeon]
MIRYKMYPPRWLAETEGKDVFHLEYKPEKIADRVDYLLEGTREGKFLYSNFPAIRETCIKTRIDSEPIRPCLGDHEHVASAALRIFSSLYLSPLFAHEFYKLGKTIGHCTIAGLTGTHSTKVTKKREIIEVQHMCCKQTGIGHIEDIEVDARRGWLRYTISENTSNIMTVVDRQHYMVPTKPSCYIEIGILCGQTEALLGGVWDGLEIGYTSKGYKSFEIGLHQQENRTTPKINMLPKEEYGRLLDWSIDLAINRRTNIGEGDVGDYQMISLSQSVNYLLLSASKGHVVLSKWAGKKVGERIIERIKANNLFDALDYLKKLFLELRIGIMEYKADPGSIRIKVTESVYSSGVNNIHMKLCIFLAGIIEGGINKSMENERTLNDEPEWIVLETKCTANGDPCCEFKCFHRDQEKLRNILIG